MTFFDWIKNIFTRKKPEARPFNFPAPIRKPEPVKQYAPVERSSAVYAATPKAVTRDVYRPVQPDHIRKRGIPTPISSAPIRHEEYNRSSNTSDVNSALIGVGIGLLASHLADTATAAVKSTEEYKPEPKTEVEEDFNPTPVFTESYRRDTSVGTPAIEESAAENITFERTASPSYERYSEPEPDRTPSYSSSDSGSSWSSSDSSSSDSFSSSSID